MRKICAGLIAVATTVAGTEALAAGKWSLLGGETVGNGGNMVYGEFGFPDVSFGFQHGMSDKVDLGIRMSLIYGVESTTNISFGMGFRVPIRIQAYRGGKVSVMFHIDPGIKFYTPGGPVPFGIQFPLGIAVGVEASREVTISFGMDLPMTIFVTPGALFTIAPLFGPGVEYHIDNNLGISFNTRFGPVIFAGGGGGFRGGGNATAEFGFVTQAGLIYNF